MPSGLMMVLGTAVRAARASSTASAAAASSARWPFPHQHVPLAQGRTYSSGSATGRVLMVFGASGGIGSALVRRLRETHPSAALVLAAHDEAKLKAVAQEVADGAGGTGHVEAHQVDARDPEKVDALVQKVLAQHGRLDAVASLVGNVMLTPGATTTSASSHLAALREAVDINLVTSFNVLHVAAKAMAAGNKGGSIVLTSAAVASTGLPNFEAMSAAKAGVEGLVRSAAATYVDSGVRVNAVAPGLTRTGQTQGMTGGGAPAATSAATHPVRHFAEPRDIAVAMAFLMDPQTDFITGQVLAVDGGLSTLTMQRHDAK